MTAQGTGPGVGGANARLTARYCPGMEKVVYLLGWPGGGPDPGRAARLVGETGPRLVGAGARGVQVNVVDAAVEPAAGLRITTSERAPDAFVSVWVDSAVTRRRDPFDRIVAAAGDLLAAHLVTESQPIVDRRPAAPDGRTDGFSQMALLQRPPRLDEAEWLGLWLDQHTQVAVDTQSTFGYTQNVVARTLLGDARHDAIVEELFPAGAMTDPRVFYDAADAEDLARRQTAMLTSVGRFVDLDRIEVIPTSRYVVQRVA